MDEWLLKPPTAGQVRREFLLKLYLADEMGTEGVRHPVKTRRGETEAILRLLTAERPATQSPRQSWMMDYALSIYNAEMDWLKRVEAQLGTA